MKSAALRPSVEKKMRKALTLNHVAFEDLGSLEAELERADFAIQVEDACTANLRAIDSLAPDLLVVLGGAIGVYERDAYPFVADEIALIRARLAAKRPTLGVCLGAQLMAAALGAKVYPGSQGKEIGWAPVEAGKDAALYPAFATLLAESRCFLHWHGDTFDLPPQARHLASTLRHPNQAFAIENYALGLQFHPEVTAQGLERWYVGNACELVKAKIDVARLREDSRRFVPKLEVAARRFWRDWLSETIDTNSA
jgi:GMP synthase (glutamine-hydrolysing)